MRIAERDLSMISAIVTEYFLGRFTWKWTWLPANPNVPNSKPAVSSSRNAAVQVSMCDCLRKQLYLYLVTNIKVTQLFLVSLVLVMVLPLKRFIALAIQNSNPEGDHDRFDRLSQTLLCSRQEGTVVVLVNLHRLQRARTAAVKMQLRED